MMVGFAPGSAPLLEHLGVVELWVSEPEVCITTYANPIVASGCIVALAVAAGMLYMAVHAVFNWWALAFWGYELNVADGRKSLHQLAVDHGVDADLLAVGAKTMYACKRTEDTSQQLKRTLTSWVERNRSAWSQQVQYDQLTKAHRLTFGGIGAEQTTRDLWRLDSVLGKIRSADATARGDLGGGVRLPAA